MLLKYTVKNFKSIGNSIEFSMIPTADSSDKRFLTTLHTKLGDIDVLRRGAFFGPNAAGKSTFMKSIQFAKNYITEPQRSGKNIIFSQFRGDIKELNKTTSFQFLFYVNGYIYEYGFALTARRVSEEWFMVLEDMESGDFSPVFTRATDEEGVTEVEIDEGYKFNDENEKLLAGILTSSMKKEQKNQLFLYKLKENGVTVAKDAVNWFEDIEIVFPDSKVRYLPNDVRNDEDFRSFLSEALEQLDTGIFDISASDEKIDFQDFAQNVSLPLPDELIYGVENNKNGLFNLGGKYYIFFDDKDHTSLVQLKFTHMLNNKGTDFSFDDESDGTKRLLDLLPILYNMKYKDTAIYFVDEIDRSLHTKLSKYLTKTFLEESKESHSQIIFTTHDVNLINLADFSKEEIWFIEKDITGETRLRPFSDFETDPRQDIIKGYLSGRFGAVPVIRGEE